MAIQEQNIVFVESQVMDDVPEGGGAATGNVIIDGQMNNVFEDISDLDRALGRFNLRKIFLAVRTLSTDLYGGVKSVITALPDDAALGYTLFSTGDPFDTRAEAVDQRHRPGRGRIGAQTRRRTVTTRPNTWTSAGSSSIGPSRGLAGRRTTWSPLVVKVLTVASSPGMPATTISPSSAVDCDRHTT